MVMILNKYYVILQTFFLGDKSSTRVKSISGANKISKSRGTFVISSRYMILVPFKLNVLGRNIQNSCDVTTSTDMLRQVVQLLMTHRDEYNKPIPKRIEFSNYPDVYWEYILEDTFDAEIEISDYTVKAKLVVV